MKILLILIFVLFTACSKSHHWSKSKMWSEIKKVDPSAELIIPDTMTAGVKCSDYKSQGCQGAFQGKLLRLEAIFVQYETQEQAKSEATRLGQYYKYNWLLDDITGEPVLEKFVTQKFGAIKPTP